MKIIHVSVNERYEPKYGNHKKWDHRTQSESKFDLRGYNKARTEYMSNTRVYVWPKGESILENLQNRKSRPYIEYKKLVTKELNEAGYTGKVRWSQYAGCTCPCSPGFVLDTQLDYAAPVDIHIDVTE